MAQIYYMGVPYGGRTTGGGDGDAYWGNIGGVLANQTDLKTALDAKSAVTANPTLEGGESDLSSIEIDGTKYSVPSGGGGGGGSTTWGSITGTLSNQTDLTTALLGKANTSDVPVSLADLVDDSSHRVVSDTEKSTWNGKSVVSWSQIVESGTKIATVTVNGTSTDVYAPTSGGGGSTTWGQITGTLANQTDLQSALDAKANLPSSETVTVSGGSASKQLTSHKLCVFDGAVLTLTVTFPATVSASDEFNFVFETSSNGCTLTVPSTVKWDGGTAPTLEANTMYEVSIDGLGIALISQGVSTTT